LRGNPASKICFMPPKAFSLINDFERLSLLLYFKRSFNSLF